MSFKSVCSAAVISKGGKNTRLALPLTTAWKLVTSAPETPAQKTGIQHSRHNPPIPPLRSITEKSLWAFKNSKGSWPVCPLSHQHRLLHRTGTYLPDLHHCPPSACLSGDCPPCSILCLKRDQRRATVPQEHTPLLLPHTSTGHCPVLSRARQHTFSSAIATCCCGTTRSPI